MPSFVFAFSSLFKFQKGIGHPRDLGRLASEKIWGQSPWKAPILFNQKKIILDLLPTARHPASGKTRGDLMLKHNTWVPWREFICLAHHSHVPLPTGIGMRGDVQSIDAALLYLWCIYIHIIITLLWYSWLGLVVYVEKVASCILLDDSNTNFVRVRNTLLSTAVSYSNTTTRLNMVTPCWWSQTLSGTSKCQMVKRALWSGSKIKSRNFKSRWFCKMQICRMEALMRRYRTTWNHFGVVESFGVWNLRWKFCISVCIIWC